MYQQQFHTSNYRGNQQGHDRYLRADSQQPSAFGATGQVVSQYRGFQRTYQPTGQVQSFYGQKAIGQQTQFANTNAFHASNYRGNQPGHDQYWRGDSAQPTGFRGGIGQVQSQYQSFANTNSFHASNYRGNQQGHDQYLRADATQPSGYGTGMSQSSYQPSFTGTNAFHTAGYRGNQPGHDQSLRADATQPSNFGAGAYQSQYMNQLQQNQF
jgi:hypothetical protein